MDSNDTLTSLGIKIKKKRKPRKFWMDPLLFERRLRGHFSIIYEVLQSDNKICSKTLGMSITSFNDLLAKVKSRITYSNTNMRLSVSPEERLTITLRHLCCGDSFTTLHTEFLVGVSTVSKIVYDTCVAILAAIKDAYMPDPSVEKWLEISDLFYERTNFPNCLGAITGKYFQLLKADSSLILMAIVDANFCFTAMDIVDSFDNCVDLNMFHASILGQKFKDIQMNIPPHSCLPGDTDGDLMPYMMVSDEAFSKSSCILRPYARVKNESRKQIFNYRCSRVTRISDSAFGILTNKWKILDEKLSPIPSLAAHIVKACFVLHNYVMKKEGVEFEETLYACNLDNLNNPDCIGGNGAQVTRGYFTDYFVSPSGAISWQESMIST